MKTDQYSQTRRFGPFWKWHDEGFWQNQPMHRHHNEPTAFHKRGSKRHRPAWAHHKTRYSAYFFVAHLGLASSPWQRELKSQTWLQRPWTRKPKSRASWIPWSRKLRIESSLPPISFIHLPVVETRFPPTKNRSKHTKFPEGKTLGITHVYWVSTIVN